MAATNLSPLHLMRHRKDPIEEVYDMAYAPDGLSYVSVSVDGSVKISDFDGASCLRVLQEADHMPVWAVAWSGDRIFTGHQNGTMKIWNATEGTLVSEFNDLSPSPAVVALNVSPAAPHLVASAANDHQIKLWALDGQFVRNMPCFDSVVYSMRFSPDGQFLATGSYHHTVQLWDVTTAELVLEFLGPSGCVRTVAFSDDGSLLAGGSDDKKIQMWITIDGRHKATLSGHTNYVWGMGFIGNNTLVSHDRHNVNVWREGELIQSLRFDNYIMTMAISLNGHKLGVAFRDGFVRLFGVLPTARHARSRAVLMLLSHLQSVDVMRGYERDYVKHHVLPELPWQAWL